MRNIGDVQYKWFKDMFEREIEKIAKGEDNDVVRG